MRGPRRTSRRITVNSRPDDRGAPAQSAGTYRDVAHRLSGISTGGVSDEVLQPLVITTASLARGMVGLELLQRSRPPRSARTPGLLPASAFGVTRFRRLT